MKNTTTDSKWNSNDCPSGTPKTGMPTCTEIAPGTTCDVNSIEVPGSYACNWNGSLLRVFDHGITSGNEPCFRFHALDPLTVTYLSNDPYASIEQCRSNCNDLGTFFNF